MSMKNSQGKQFMSFKFVPAWVLWWNLMLFPCVLPGTQIPLLSLFLTLLLLSYHESSGVPMGQLWASRVRRALARPAGGMHLLLPPRYLLGDGYTPSRVIAYQAGMKCDAPGPASPHHALSIQSKKELRMFFPSFSISTLGWAHCRVRKGQS